MIPILARVSADDVVRAQRAFASTSIDDALAELNADWQALEVRRANREHRRLVRATPQCGGCRRFLRNAAHECPSCGYLDGRGYSG